MTVIMISLIVCLADVSVVSNVVIVTVREIQHNTMISGDTFFDFQPLLGPVKTSMRHDNEALHHAVLDKQPSGSPLPFPSQH